MLLLTDLLSPGNFLLSNRAKKVVWGNNFTQHKKRSTDPQLVMLNAVEC